MNSFVFVLIDVATAEIDAVASSIQGVTMSAIGRGDPLVMDDGTLLTLAKLEERLATEPVAWLRQENTGEWTLRIERHFVGP